MHSRSIIETDRPCSAATGRTFGDPKELSTSVLSTGTACWYCPRATRCMATLTRAAKAVRLDLSSSDRIFM